MGQMLGGGSIQLGRIFGIRIGASPSWFVVLFIMIFALSGYFSDTLTDASSTTAYAVAVAGAALFFVSLILHELGHALVARRSGIGISGIDLWFFGGLAKMTRDTSSPGEEFRVAAAGPAVTLVIVAACLGFGASTEAFTRDGETTPAQALLGWLAVVNGFLLVFNLVPAFPLDGGRIARAVAWKITGDRARGTRFSARLGQGFAYLLIGLGIYLLFTSDPINGLWFAILGWFLGQAARGAVATSRFTERLEGVTVADVMDSEPVWVPGDEPAARVEDEFFARYRWPWFPVADPSSGQFHGLVTADRVEAAIAGGQPEAPARDLVEPRPHDDGDALSVRSDAPIEHLLGSEGLRSRGALMVGDADGRLAGVVTLDQVRRALTAAAPTRLG
jgi:Zn-dependent protease